MINRAIKYSQGASGEVKYDYNQHNLLIISTVDNGSGHVPAADFASDGAGSRLWWLVDHRGAQPITITFTNDIVGLSLVLAADDGTTQVTNLFGLNLILHDRGSEVRLPLADGLGSVRTEMVGWDVGSVTTYSPYGGSLVQEGTSNTNYGFTGEQEDSATGLLYLRARYHGSSTSVTVVSGP